MVFKHTVFALVLALPAFAQQSVWGQCGGQGWTGATTCVSGSTCSFQNNWFSQCLPGAASSSAAPPPPSSTVVTPPSSSPASTVSSSSAPTSTGAASCPTLPSNPSASFKSDTKLPNPFTFFDGTPVTTKAQWDCRRAEISQLFQTYELGTLPGKPDNVTGSLSGNTLTVNVSQGGKSISFQPTVTMPSGTGPFPAIIAVGGLSIPTPSGVAVINFNNGDIAAQNDGSSRGQGKFYTLYGANHSAGAMIAWAWGVSRIIDVLETLPNSNFDLTKLAVSGCSRNGKGAMVAGAFEPRIWLTIPQESGSGGAGSWRISDTMLAAGQDTQTANEIVDENVWFSTNFNAWTNETSMLPFDHHLLAGMVAPRPMLVIDNTNYTWLGPESVWGAMKTATKIYQALGIPDYMGVSQIGNHAHCAFPSNEQSDLDAFVNRFLKGQNANTSIVRTDGLNGASSFVDSQWVDWTVPTLT